MLYGRIGHINGKRVASFVWLSCADPAKDERFGGAASVSQQTAKQKRMGLYVVQSYIEPLLLHGRKFDIRMYAYTLDFRWVLSFSESSWAHASNVMQCVVAFDCLVAGMCWWPRQSQLCSSGGRVIYDALCSLTIRLRCGERKDDETHTHHSRPHIVRLDRFDRKRTKRTNAVMLSREPPMDAHQTCIHIRD